MPFAPTAATSRSSPTSTTARPPRLSDAPPDRHVAPTGRWSSVMDRWTGAERGITSWQRILRCYHEVRSYRRYPRPFRLRRRSLSAPADGDAVCSGRRLGGAPRPVCARKPGRHSRDLGSQDPPPPRSRTLAAQASPTIRVLRLALTSTISIPDSSTPCKAGTATATDVAGVDLAPCATARLVTPAPTYTDVHPNSAGHDLSANDTSADSVGGSQWHYSDGHDHRPPRGARRFLRDGLAGPHVT